MKPFDSATQRLELLHQAHVANVDQISQGNIYHVIQSFNSYMAFARHLSGLEAPESFDRSLAASTAKSSGVQPVCPTVNQPRPADRFNNQLHGLIFKDSKRLRRKEDLVKFQHFLANHECASDYGDPYWKLVLGEPLQLSDFTRLNHVEINILRLALLVQYKVELNLANPELMLLQCRKLQAQQNPRRREENNKFLFKRFFKWVQKQADVSPRQAFETFRREVLGAEFSDEDIREYFRVVRDTPAPFGTTKQFLERVFHIPSKINTEFENKLLRIPRLREELLVYMERHLPGQARDELKDLGARCMFRFYLILKEIDLNSFSSALSNYVFSKKCKASWTVGEVNEIIRDMTARIHGMRYKERSAGPTADPSLTPGSPPDPR